MACRMLKESNDPMQSVGKRARICASNTPQSVPGIVTPALDLTLSRSGIPKRLAFEDATPSPMDNPVRPSKRSRVISLGELSAASAAAAAEAEEEFICAEAGNGAEGVTQNPTHSGSESICGAEDETGELCVGSQLVTATPLTNWQLCSFLASRQRVSAHLVQPTFAGLQKAPSITTKGTNNEVSQRMGSIEEDLLDRLWADVEGGAGLEEYSSSSEM